MEFIAKRTQIQKQKTHCAVVFALKDQLLDSAKTLDDSHGGIISHYLASGDLKTKAGEKAWVILPKKDKSQAYDRVLLVQLGESKSDSANSVSQKSYLTAIGGAAKSIEKSKAKNAVFYIDDLVLAEVPENASNDAWIAKMTAMAITQSGYRYNTTKSSVELPDLKKVNLSFGEKGSLKDFKAGLIEGAATGEGINSAREFGNLPGNICTPSYFAQEAKKLAAKCPKLTTRAIGEKQMEKLGMHSFLSVSKGSDEEGKLIILEYKGSAKSSKPIVLVGKGITFDTGGISLKPGAAMDEMKFDMCGAASVMGVFKALVEMNANVHVVGIIAAAENMPSGRASKPGDVVTSMSGQTIEILNTDAEGRLVLCDALTYAERYKPKAVVDIATLTGACVIALGRHASGLYANNDELAEQLLDAGEATSDRAWRMPLWDEYQPQLDSNFADMANIGGREAGSVTAACFLSRFTKKYPWAHIDIAGAAWHSGAAKGATGRPVSLLVQYILNA